MLKNIFSIKNEYIKDKKYKKISIFSKTLLQIEVKNKIKNCVGILDIAGIGDYVLQRPYFKYFKKSPKYKNRPLVYFIKKHYLNMYNAYDLNCFDYVIPWDNSEATKNLMKKFEFTTLINLNSLNKQNNFKGAMHRYNIITQTKCDEKIADVIFDNEMDKNPIFKENLAHYTKLIITKNNVFETERLKEFFEKLLEIEIPLENKTLSPLVDFKNKNNIAISLFTAAKDRNYIDKHWIKILNHILSKTNQNTNILFLGSSKEHAATQQIINKLKDKKRCTNLCGLVDISLIPTILAHCNLLISPETGTVHIAESVNCPVICLCAGGYYKRFQPYKKGVQYIYPDKFENLIQENNPILADFYNRNNTFKMKDIHPEKIIKILENYLINLDKEILNG